MPFSKATIGRTLIITTTARRNAANVFYEHVHDHGSDDTWRGLGISGMTT